MKVVYYHFMLPNLSLFFYKSSDSVYLLEFFSHKISKGDKEFTSLTDKDFWVRTEDLLMRVKQKYNVQDMARIAHVFSKINMGTNLFWQEIE
jgi:hypothetical protein